MNKLRDGMKQCYVKKEVTEKNQKLACRIATVIRISINVIMSILNESEGILRDAPDTKVEALYNTLEELGCKMENVHIYVDLLAEKKMSKAQVDKLKP